MNQTLKAKLSVLPLQPGCYLMKDQQGKIIYVGKAKKLKNRVNQYFVGAHQGKTQKMVSEVVDFDVIITASEKDAYLLEINLIKQHRPPYNIMFMDDKSYPMIKITNETFPRLLVVRDRIKDKKAKYFGPYPDAKAARETVKLLHELYPIRKCDKMPKTLCLYYHIGRCSGPCVFKDNQQDYHQHIKDIQSFLKGDGKTILDQYQQQMEQATKELAFEQAALIRDRMLAIQYILQRQQVSMIDTVEDIFGVATNHGLLAVVGFMVRQGKLILKSTHLGVAIDPVIEQVESVIFQFYQDHPKPKSLLLPSAYQSPFLEETLNIQINYPQKGIKAHLLKMATDNANHTILMHTNTQKTLIKKEQLQLDGLARLLKLQTINTIELYDVSHISGAYAVGTMVTFKNNLMDKSNYRKYKLHQHNNDVESLKEMIYRRALRALKENKPLSDVLMVDGGINQVNAATSVLNSLGLHPIVVGLSKDNKHKTSMLLLPNQEPIALLPDDELTLSLMNMQEEVHRFAINYHRQLRSKGQLVSTLDQIEGIGPTRKNQLIKAFGSLKAIKEASLEQLSQVVSQQVAKNLIQYFEKEKEQEDESTNWNS